MKSGLPGDQSSEEFPRGCGRTLCKTPWTVQGIGWGPEAFICLLLLLIEEQQGFCPGPSRLRFMEMELVSKGLEKTLRLEAEGCKN